MPRTAIMMIDGGLDTLFSTAVIGLYCLTKKNEMPSIFNAYALNTALEGKSNALNEVKRIWSIGAEIEPKQAEELKTRGLLFAAVSTPSSEESGSKVLMDSPIGQTLLKTGAYPNLVEIATLANVWSKRLLRTDQWSKARALNYALKAFGKCPWKTPDKFLAEWKMILSEPDALQILTDSGQAMCDWDDSVTQQEINGNGGLLEFAGSRWICLNGHASWLDGRDLRPPTDHDGVISWCWCPREGLWKLTFYNEGKASIQEALNVCASRTTVAKTFQYRNQSAVAYMQDIPFPLADVKYFWKFPK